MDDEDLVFHLEELNSIVVRNKQLLDSVTSDLIDTVFLDEIKAIVNCGGPGLYFGQTLRDLKLVIQDDSGLRDHEILLRYKAPRKLQIRDLKLPHSYIQNREYNSLDEVITTFKKYINELSQYFYELETIDLSCAVMEPINASFKDDFRRILLDDRTWLHVGVTPEGSATNIHLVGQSAHWHNKLQSGLLAWDHDKNIVENIMSIFDLSAFTQSTRTTLPILEHVDKAEDFKTCSICLTVELPGSTGVPQPLCQNPVCGVFYHRNCLYQWLVVCAGNRRPAFGVANGECPACLQPISCSENDT